MTCWGSWPSFICSKSMLNFMDTDTGMACGCVVWGGGAAGWGRNRDSETQLWIAVVPLELEPKLHRCPAGRAHMEPLGLGTMEIVTHSWDIFQFNCWSSPFSLPQWEQQWGDRETHLGCYSNINPPRQGQREIKIHCHFTQLSAPVQAERNKKRSGSMLPIGSTSASVYPDTQMKVQWEEFSEHEIK